MGLMNTLRKFCVMKSVRDKTKEESEHHPKDKYDEKIPYVEITKRRFIMTTKDDEISKMRKDIDENIDQQISELSKKDTNDLTSLYEDVKYTKNSFRENENLWSRTGKFDEKAGIVYSGFKKLQEAAKEEIERRKANN